MIGGSGGSMITTAMALVSAINWIHLLGVVAAVSNYGWKLLFHFILSSLSLSLSVDYEPRLAGYGSEGSHRCTNCVCKRQE